MRIKKSKLNKLIESLLTEQEEIDFDAGSKGSRRKRKKIKMSNLAKNLAGGKAAAELTPEQIKKIQEEEFEDPARMLKNLTGEGDPRAGAIYVTMKTVFNNETVVAAHEMLRKTFSNQTTTAKSKLTDTERASLKDTYELMIDAQLNVYNLLTISPPNLSEAKKELNVLKDLIEKDVPTEGVVAVSGFNVKDILSDAVNKVLESFNNPAKAEKTAFEQYRELTTSYGDSKFSIVQYLNKMKRAAATSSGANVRDFNFQPLAETASRSFASAARAFKAGKMDLTISRLKVVFGCLELFPQSFDRTEARRVVAQLISLAGGQPPVVSDKSADKLAQGIDKMTSEEEIIATIDEQPELSDTQKEEAKKAIRSSSSGATKSTEDTVKEIQAVIGAEQTGKWTSGDPEKSQTQAAWEKWLDSPDAFDMLKALAQKDGLMNESLSLDNYILSSIRSRKLAYIMEAPEDEPGESSQITTDEELRDIMRKAKKDSKVLSSFLGYANNASGVRDMLQAAQQELYASDRDFQSEFDQEAETSEQEAETSEQEAETAEEETEEQEPVSIPAITDGYQAGAQFSTGVKSPNGNFFRAKFTKNGNVVLNADPTRPETAEQIKAIKSRLSPNDLKLNATYYKKLAIAYELQDIYTHYYKNYFADPNGKSYPGIQGTYSPRGNYVLSASFFNKNGMVKISRIRIDAKQLVNNLDPRNYSGKLIVNMTGGLSQEARNVRRRIALLVSAYDDIRDFSSGDRAKMVF